MVAADRPVRNRTLSSDIPPLSHRGSATALPEAVDRAAMLPHIDLISKESRGKQTACMPSSQRSLWF